jgi:hypothetical protein
VADEPAALLFPKPSKRAKGAWRTRRYPLKRGGPVRRSRVAALVSRRALEAEAESVWRMIVYAKAADGLCVVCRKRPYHDAMHGFPKGPYPWMRYDPDNGLPGCRPCHRRIDSDFHTKREVWIRCIGQARFERLELVARARHGKMDLRAQIFYLKSLLP